MSLPHALLAALIEEPCSGIDLSSRFDRSIGYYWHATHQQIYRELGRMEAAGWVSSLPLETGRGSKRVYQVLPEGRDELRRWAGQMQDPPPLRSELMLRLRAEVAVGDTRVAADIARRLPMHRARLAIFREIEARDFADSSRSRSLRIQHLMLKAGIMTEAMWVQWSEEALEVLK